MKAVYSIIMIHLFSYIKSLPKSNTTIWGKTAAIKTTLRLAAMMLPSYAVMMDNNNIIIMLQQYLLGIALINEY